MVETAFEAPAPETPGNRRSAIARALERSSGRTHHVPFRTGYVDAPIARVDHAVLVYRADNGRLFSEMVARGASREQREDASQQRLLHELLVEKARDPDGPIYAELELHAKQTEPLLVAADGLIVNGNRRLASMRELLARDPERYGSFAEVEVAVLPGELSHADLEYIEAALQLAPELKLAYSWVNRRLKLRDHVERLGLSEDQIVAAYRFADASAIETELAQLDLAEHFLRYCGTPADYARVADLEEPITAMHRELSAISNRPLIELWTYAGFALLAEREAIDRPFDHYFPFTRPRPFETLHWVMRSIAEEEGLVEPQPAGENRPVRPDLSRRLLPLLRDGDRCSAHVAQRVTALADKLRANQEHEIGGAQLLLHLRKAKENLQRTGPGDVSPVQAREIRAELLALTDYLEGFGGPAAGDEPEGNRSIFARLIGR